jgi:transcriptional regulator GlxA family with amidase domain
MKRTRKAHLEMRDNPESDWDTQRITEMLKVSKRKLHRIFVKEYGIPPYEMLTKLRLSKAWIKLSRSEDSVANISRSLGYHNSFSFSNLFKKHMRMRPTEYRKKFKSSEKYEV